MNTPVSNPNKLGSLLLDLHGIITLVPEDVSYQTKISIIPNILRERGKDKFKRTSLLC